MQEYALVGRGYVQDRAHLLSGDALNITHDDHHALPVRQPGERFLQLDLQLAVERALLRRPQDR